LYRRLLEAVGYGGNRELFLTLAQTYPWCQLQPALQALQPSRRRRLAETIFSRAAADIPWRTQGLRPANKPLRRLMGAAALLARFTEKGLVIGLMEAVREGAKRGPEALQKALVVNEGKGTLIGSSRAGEIAVNAVLPFAAAWGTPPLPSLAEALYQRWPRPSAYGIVRHLDRALLAGKRGGLSVNARRQQGMLYLYKTECSQGHCGRCPLS